MPRRVSGREKNAARLERALAAMNPRAVGRALDRGAVFTRWEAINAIDEGDVAKLGLLLDFDSPVFNGGPTPLQEAVRQGNLECVRLLMDRRPLDAMAKMAWGETALMLAARIGWVEMLPILAPFSDLGAVDGQGRGVLEKCGDDACRRALLSILAGREKEALRGMDLGAGKKASPALRV